MAFSTSYKKSVGFYSLLDLPSPSGILWLCHSVIIQMKLEYLWGHLANLDKILYEASLGWGKDFIRFWDRLNQNSGFHSNRKRPLTYNGENDVSTFSLLFFNSLEPKAHKVFLWYTYGTSSSVVSVLVHTFKLEYLWSQLANLDQILCVASLGWGKVCIRFWGRLDQNAGFHGNRKPPLTYNGENDVSTFSRLFLIWSFLYLQLTRTCIKSRTSLNFGQIGPLTMELAALEI